MNSRPADLARPIQIADSQVCCDDPWERAYLRFETAEQEIHKFMKRLSQAGARSWPADSEIVELFCGRGNGLHALHRVGFTRIEGVDLSASLLAQYRGPASCYVADCRALPFEDGTKDILIVQGGLHHLPTLPEDLERCLAEAHRVLRDGGRFVAVEPWMTPFLSVVHAACRSRPARRLWTKLDALATMIDHERPTYEAWLARPVEILRMLGASFEPERSSTGWGKLSFVGKKRKSS